jgi:hypothetical protein
MAGEGVVLPTVLSEGGLLPPDLLQRIVEQDTELGSLAPTDYGLGPHERLGEAIARAWQRARAYWAAFQAATDDLPPGESGVEQTRHQWVLPLLRALGYAPEYQAAGEEVGGRVYRISHRDGPVPIHIVSCRQDLDRVPPAARGDARLSPHALVQEYLNSRPDALYGLVTNGVRLRLLRDHHSLTRLAYVEWDLAAMFAGGVYADFALLWLTLHRSRLPQAGAEPSACPLERWRERAETRGVRAFTELRKGVERALVALGTGLLAHPANERLRERLRDGALSTEAFYAQLLRLVYRLLFLAVAEERDLLFPPDADPAARKRYARAYGLSRLRDEAWRYRDDTRHDDRWRALTLVFDLLAGRRTGLGLAPLGGGLFDRQACPDLDAPDVRVANAALAEALLHLSRVQVDKRWRRVSYRDLNTEELGGIYEALLDYQPRVVVDAASPRFELVESCARKQTGSYYTPPALVQELVRAALEPVIVDRLAGAQTPQARERALLGITVCDPAAGSGHFLVAAARWLAAKLARERAGDREPSLPERRQALRDVVRQCLYGVDRNPLAVDLCKVALWLESHEPGHPLTFLDHHIKCGDSLVGVWDLAALAKGVPDGAYEPVAGDDRQRAAAFKRRNRQERAGQLDLFAPTAALPAELARDFAELGAAPDDTPADVAFKAELYLVLRARGTRWYDLHTACDLWTAAFFVPLRATDDGADLVPTTATVGGMLTRPAAAHGELVGRAVALARERRAFHWPLEFPDVWAAGGFDVVLGNPPWEKVEMDEPEWFASHDSTIAELPGIKRKQAIAALEKTQSPLWLEFQQASRNVASFTKFVKQSGRFCLTGQGRINLYALFAELSWRLLNARGRAGIIVPTGIATDDTTKRFFQEIVERGALAALFDFENREGLFPAVDSRVKFCALVLAAAGQPRGELAFFLTHPDQLRDARRVFALDAADFALLNPNTRTCPVFRTRADADLTRAIYRRVPVLVDERANANPWGVEFKQGLFNMTSDSGLFATVPAPDHVPLYEAKLFHQFDHRFATYARGERTREATAAEHADPCWQPTPRYWVARAEVERRLAGKWDRPWLIAFRDIARSTDERTAIFCVLPRVAVGHTAPLVLAQDASPAQLAALVGCCNSLVLDYVARQKVGGTHLTYTYLTQFPVLPPAAYTADDLAFIVPRVLELVYTAWDLQPFARDLGYDGPPFPWDEGRRAVLRAELDAYYAALYGLTYDELRYILDPADVYGPDFPSETFRVLKQNELTRYGAYRTRRLVLAAWERLGLTPRHRDGRYATAVARAEPTA